MNHSLFHWLDKWQVKLAAAGGAAVSYFAVWPLVRPHDPLGPATFLATGSIAELLTLVVVVGLLAVAVAMVTLQARPQGGVLATMFAVGGIALRSGQVRALFWQQADGYSGMYILLIAELLVLMVVMYGMAVMVGVIRGLFVRIKPEWMWKPPALLTAEGEQTPADAPTGRRFGLLLAPLGMGTPAERAEGIRGTDEGQAPTARQIRVQSAKFFGLAMGVAVVLLGLLLRSPDRGQILFAVAASFFVGTLIAQWRYPTPMSAAAWLLPVGPAIVCYLWGATVPVGPQPNDWTNIPLLARVLPLDWATFACGGALAGQWLAARMHERKRLEKLQETQNQTTPNTQRA